MTVEEFAARDPAPGAGFTRGLPVDHDGTVKAMLATLGVAGLAAGAGAAWLAANRSFLPYQTADAPFCLVVA